jgi:nucleoside-diphosphate-sugar epimerase
MDALTSQWQGRRVLVTGCTEFLGGAVTRELLGRGASIVGLISERGQGAEYVREIAAGRLRLTHGDPRDAARLHSAMVVHEVSAVFHLAELDSAPAVRAGSLSRIPVICSRPPHRLSLAEGEMMHPPPIGIARFDELFGPGDRDTTRAIPRVLLALLGGQPNVPITGAVRDYVFIRDAARACVDLAEAVGRAGHSLDRSYRSGWEFSDAQMMKAIASAIDGSPQVSAPSDSYNLQPERPFAEAIAETVEWYRKLAHSMSPAGPARRAA